MVYLPTWWFYIEWFSYNNFTNLDFPENSRGPIFPETNLGPTRFFGPKKTQVTGDAGEWEPGSSFAGSEQLSGKKVAR